MRVRTLVAVVAVIWAEVLPARTAGGQVFDGVAPHLVIGAPNEDLSGRNGTVQGAGAVHVLKGTECDFVPCFTGAGDQLWTQDSPGIVGTAGTEDRFGAAIAYGDFDDDNEDDMAVGVPGEMVNGLDGAGAVNVIYGSYPEGLTAGGNQLLTQSTPGVVTTPEAGAAFGHALAAGDFNTGDGYDDLAIGVPYGDPPPNQAEDAGMVIVIYGSPDGLDPSTSEVWSQDAAGISEIAQSGDRFGWSLAAGIAHCNSNLFREALAIGVPFEDLPGPGSSLVQDAGVVNVLYSSAKLHATGNQVWSQASTGVPGAPEAGDRFGWAVGLTQDPSGTYSNGGIYLAVAFRGRTSGRTRMPAPST